MIRLGAQLALALGLTVSVLANVAAAERTPIGMLVAAWSPIALFIAIGLLERMPATGRRSWPRMAATALIAGIAAWVSYWHMVTVALIHGERALSAHLLPLSVDGLVAVASVCLLELRGARTAPQELPMATEAPVAPEAAQEPPRDAPRPVTPLPMRPRPEAPTLPPAATVNADLLARVTRLLAEHPDWSDEDLGAAIGRSVRTARRYRTIVARSGASEELAS